MRSRREFIKLGTIGTALGCSPFVFNIINVKVFTGIGDSGKFLQACAEGKAEEVKKMLGENSKLIAAKDEVGRSGFALALLAGHSSVAALLKNAGYTSDLHETVLALDWDRFDELAGKDSKTLKKQINAYHPIGGNAMWGAAAGGAGTSIWRIYAKCGDPNYMPKNAGTSAVQKALRFRDLSTAEMTAATLLGNDANPNVMGDGDQPPLHIAAERGSYDLVEMMIRLGADINKKDKDGKLASQIASQFGHQFVWQLLENHQKIARSTYSSRAAYNADGQAYQSPEMQDLPLLDIIGLVGSSHGNIEAVKKAVETDSRMAHSVATTNEKAVEASAHMGRKKLVEFLLQQGAPYSLPTAVMLGDYTTVKRLLDEDPKRIHERAAHDFALLWYPIIGQCDLDMTQLLLDRGANIEAQHYLGTTALHWACIRGPIELVELLIENGADVNRVGRKFGREPRRPLQMTKDEKIINFLKSKGAK